MIPLTINKVFLACAVHGKSNIDAEFLEGLMQLNLLVIMKDENWRLHPWNAKKGILSQDVVELLFDFLAEYGVTIRH